MHRSRRLEPVVRIAKSREEHAAKELAACQKRVDECEEQLVSLRGFRAEYGQRLQAAAQAGIPSREFHDFTSFITRLDKAIDQQQRLLGQLRGECEAKRQHWVASRARSLALDKAVTRYTASEVRAEARKEQLAADERAQRIAPQAYRFKK
jgi:flagellar FliJ protein